MKVLIAPTAFKQSLSPMQAAQAIERGLERALPEAELRLFPIADGGNGTLEAWLSQGGERQSLRVHDPLMRPIEAAYGMLPDGKTAIIEMALASGLELLKRNELNPLLASSFGTGELLQAALERGARRFIIGMGGSATVDGGAGALAALGIRFLDVEGRVIEQGGGTLHKIDKIDASSLDARWQDCDIIIASDVENPLLGAEGAAAVFGPQKGASPDDVQVLENSLAHFAAKLAETGREIRHLAGTGAAGGLSAGLLAFLGGRIESGIDLLLQYNHFEKQLGEIDLIITGEGQMDEQTLYGKGAIGLARLAKERGIPVIALVGGLNVGDSILHEAGVTAAFSIVDKPMALEKAIANAEGLLEAAALRLGYVLGIQPLNAKAQRQGGTKEK
jgi:glycerate 2-kinase